jgi:hypothetical protein
MSKMMELVEQMLARVNQITDAEQALVRALGDALSRVDRKVLQDVRNITTDHESRRGAILHELQTLASRIGAFPVPREEVPELDYADPVARHVAETNSDYPPRARGGNWRQAANNIDDDLDVYVEKRASSHY